MSTFLCVHPNTLAIITVSAIAGAVACAALQLAITTFIDCRLRR